MGDFEAFLLGKVESSVKYHSVEICNLTLQEKPVRNSIWWVVLVGRYPPKE